MSMTREKLDALWQQAIRQSVGDGNLYARYDFAELVIAEEKRRSDALAATINALRDVVTTEAESKAEFVARVRAVLGACPDTRVLHAVQAESDACARICDKNSQSTSAEEIRARWQA